MTFPFTMRVPFRLSVCGAVALLLLVGGMRGAAAAAARASRTHTVVIEGTAFTPATLKIAAGDTVQWSWPTVTVSGWLSSACAAVRTAWIASSRVIPLTSTPWIETPGMMRSACECS